MASAKIASLRYDKRTYVYGENSTDKNEDINIRNEVLDDAGSVIEFCANLEGIDGIYLLGHSLGGMLAPRIATEHKDIAGIILMAGNARPLEQLIREQYIYLLSRDGLTENEQNILRDLDQKLINLDELKAHPKETTLELPLGLSSTYWLSLLSYNQLEEIQLVSQRILILQGERDYQVTMKDFKIWQEALHDTKTAGFKSYPKLNHLFLEGEGPSYPAEYQQKGNIPDYVIKDIAAWIFKDN